MRPESRRPRRFPRQAQFVAALALALVFGPRNDSLAETLLSAMARAYRNNPDLNQTRASVRARDEDVPKAEAGMRPKASISGNFGAQFSTVKIPAGRDNFGKRAYSSDEFLGNPRGATLNVTQNVFDAGRTANSVRQAQSSVFAARAGLRQTEQTILQTTATAYMNVLRDTAILDLRKNNLKVLGEQLRLTRDRFDVGEVTRTDVAQAEASESQARSDVYAAEAQLKISAASYLQVVGVAPQKLQPAQSVEGLLPQGLDAAVAAAQAESPTVVNALHQIDAAELAVKVAEAALSPTVSVAAQVGPQYDSFLGFPNTRQFSAQATGQLNVPIYQGGMEYAAVRQAKEQLAQARLTADSQRDSVRVSVVTGYAQLDAARASIASNQSAVRAAEIALRGVREEAEVGQRTTLDVLNAQLALLNARVNLVVAQRDRVVASYAALAAVGRASAQYLRLDAAPYEPAVHYEQTKDRWFGLDTPDGH